MRYVDEMEGLKMIVESGAPMLIVSVGWLENYLREMGVDKKDVQEKRCKRRFKFGERVYNIEKEVTMPKLMQDENGE